MKGDKQNFFKEKKKEEEEGTVNILKFDSY